MATTDSNTPRPLGFKDCGFNNIIRTVKEVEQQGAKLTYPDFAVYFPDHSKHLPDNLYPLALGYIDAVCAIEINTGQINYPTIIDDGQCDPENIVNPFQYEIVNQRRVFNTGYFNSCNKASRLLFLAVTSFINDETRSGVPKESELMAMLNMYAFWIIFWGSIQ